MATLASRTNSKSANNRKVKGFIISFPANKWKCVHGLYSDSFGYKGAVESVTRRRNVEADSTGVDLSGIN